MKMVKRAASVVTVFLLLGSLLACSRGGQSPSVSGSGSAGDDFSQRVTITAYAFIDANEPDGRKTDPVSKLIEEKFNINLELSAVTEMDWATQFSAMLAAGDLPDIFIFPTDYLKHFQSLMAADSLLALDPYVKDYAPYSAQDPNALVMIEAYKGPAFSPDGKQYIWGMCKGTWDDGTMPTCGYYILWDVYKKAGYPKLDSLEDLPDVLEKMVAAEPRSISGEKTYGVSGWFGESGGWGEWVIKYGTFWQNAAEPIEASAFTLAVSTVDSTPINVNIMTDPNSIYWQVMKFYNKVNQKGILDPDSFTQTQEVYGNKLNDGRYMFNVPGWMAGTANVEFSKIPGNTRTFVSLPGLNQKAEYRYGNMYRGERMYGVNGKTRYPERCIALLDYLSSYEFSRLAWNGVESMNWNMVNGKPIPTPEYLDATRNISMYLATGAQAYHHFQGYGNGTIDPANGITVDLYQYSPQAVEKKMNAAIRDFCAYYGGETLNDVYISQTPVTKAISMLSFGEVPDDLQNDINGLNAYINKNYARVIMARDDAEYARLRDEMIAGMANFRADEIFTYFYNEALKQGDQVKKLASMIGE
jgi:ABC-type glycerol-3-phosphate transport system substrate-binding protein